MIHCSPVSPPPRSRLIAGRATFTTVASRAATADPSTDAASTHRPVGVPSRTSLTRPSPPPPRPLETEAAYASLGFQSSRCCRRKPDVRQADVVVDPVDLDVEGDAQGERRRIAVTQVRHDAHTFVRLG